MTSTANSTPEIPTKYTTPTPLWNRYIQDLAEKYELKASKPTPAVKYLLEIDIFQIKNHQKVLDLGSELGKNALPFLENNCLVSLCDISPLAIKYCLSYFSRLHLPTPVATYTACVSELPIDTMPSFDVITASYVFSFLKKESLLITLPKLFSLLAPEGFFASSFFGMQHGWVSHAEPYTDVNTGALSLKIKNSEDRPATLMTFINKSQLIDYFSKNDMEIILIKELEEKANTVYDGKKFSFIHTISLQKNAEINRLTGISQSLSLLLIT